MEVRRTGTDKDTRGSCQAPNENSQALGTSGSAIRILSSGLRAKIFFCCAGV